MLKYAEEIITVTTVFKMLSKSEESSKAREILSSMERNGIEVKVTEEGVLFDSYAITTEGQLGAEVVEGFLNRFESIVISVTQS